GFMGRRSLRAVEQKHWVERSPAKCEIDSRYSACTRLQSCALICTRQVLKSSPGAGAFPAPVSNPRRTTFPDRSARISVLTLGGTVGGVAALWLTPGKEK